MYRLYKLRFETDNSDCDNYDVTVPLKEKDFNAVDEKGEKEIVKTDSYKIDLVKA